MLIANSPYYGLDDIEALSPWVLGSLILTITLIDDPVIFSVEKWAQRA